MGQGLEQRDIRDRGNQAARQDDLETPDPSDARATRIQANGLLGAVIALEIDNSPGRRTQIRRILAAEDTAA